MRFIAAAIIVASGCLLWSAGMFGVTLARIHNGNVGAGNWASWGGFLVTVAGLGLSAHTVFSDRGHANSYRRDAG